jgi:hypothetical protein
MKLMKHVFVMVFAFALLAGAAVPSFAQDGNPSQRCVNDTIMIEVAPGVFIPLEIPSHGGCVSSVATGALSQAAYIANCKRIKQTDPEAFYRPTSVNPEQYGFGGKLNTCADVLRAYHTGQYGH